MLRKILMLSAVLLVVLAAGPAAWADNIAAAGDISQPIGGSRNDQATARLIAPSSGNGIGLVLALGDTQYECGEMENYLPRRVRSELGAVQGNHPTGAGAPRVPDQFSRRMPGTGSWSQTNAATCRSRLLPVLCWEDATASWLLLVQRRGMALRRPQHDLHGGAGWVLGGDAELAEGRPGGEQARQSASLAVTYSQARSRHAADLAGCKEVAFGGTST